MSDSEKKRKAEETVIEKIYKKIKKLEDHYYSLKKGSTSASKSSQDGSVAGQATTNEAGSSFASTTSEVIDLLDLQAIVSPNNESELQDDEVPKESSVEEIQEASIDEEALLILGEDPSSCAPRKFQLHSNLAFRWKAWISSGLEKDARVSLLKEYSREGNCPLEAPILNPELIASINETAVKRDKHFIDSQCLIGSAMSALGSAITLLLNDKNVGVDRNELLKRMCDSGKLLADLHHKESVARKAYILPGLDKKAKSLLGKIETDSYLFGANLSEKLKSAKAVEKAGLDLKLQPAKPIPPKAPLKTSNPVNWKSPSARFSRTYQAGNSNQRGSYTRRSTSGRPQQENRTFENTQNQNEKSSKGKK